MPGPGRLETLKCVREEDLPYKVVVPADHPDSEDYVTAIKSGALRSLRRSSGPALIEMRGQRSGGHFRLLGENLAVVLLLTVIAVPFQWTIAIGIFTGASNVVPCMGIIEWVGLCTAEEIRPLLPMVSAENFAIWVIVAVALAELLKNVVYEPVVLGGAVKLAPSVVVIRVLGGAVLFGPVGMLLASLP